MEGQGFNFKDFIMKFITEHATVENMQLSEKLSVKEYTARLFDNQELMETVLKISSADEAVQAQELSKDCDSLLGLLNNFKINDIPSMKNVNEAFERTVAFNSAVYAKLVEQYCFIYLEDADEVIVKTGAIIAKAAELGVTDIAQGVWDLARIDAQRGPKYFSITALNSMVTAFQKISDDIGEKEEKAAEKVEKDATKTDDTEQDLNKKLELAAAFESSLAPLGKIAAELSDLIGDSITEGSPAGFGIYTSASAGGSELYCISAKSDGGLTAAPFTLSPDLDPTVKASVIADVKQTDYLIQQQLNQYERNMATETEDLAASLASRTPGYWLNYMLTLTTGYVACLKGKYNLKAAATADIIKLNTSETRVSSAADIRNYIYWSLSEMIIDTALQKGIQPGQLSVISAYADECINYILSQALQTYIRTYVQLAKRKNNYGKKVPKTGTILLVHFGTAYQDENALEALKAKLEATFISRGGLIDVSPVQGDNLYSISICVQPYGEVKDPDFLGNHLDQVRDNIWSGNLLLGINNNRAYYLPFDLENDQTTSKHLFTMYAASRSGKGNLTLTILAQALKAGIDIAYVDCKPETGVALGQIAWLNNMEAFVFNGTKTGLAPYSGPMESHAGQMRTNYLKLAGSVPSAITKTVAEKLRTFIPYIKSLYLCMLASRLRAEQPSTYAKNSSLWIFDEVQSASSLEKELNRLLDDELKDLKAKQKVKKGETVPAGVDEAIAYIEAYEKLKKAISTQMTEFSTKNLGKAKMTVFFIFQEPSWIKENQKGHGSLIADFVEMIGGNSTKLIGRNAVKAACGPYGYAGVLNKSWYKQICATASWALYEGAVGHGEVPPTLIFKPYDVWGCPLAPNGEAQPPAEMNVTLASEDGLRYFQRVVQEMVGLSNAAQMLNRTYNEMLPVVQSFTNVSEVKDYVYSVECTSELNPTISSNDTPIDIDIDNELEQPVNEQPVNEQPVEFEQPTDGQPVEFQPKNDGHDEAREEQARARAAQQEELRRLMELSNQNKKPPVMPTQPTGDDLAERLKNLSNMSGDEQAAAIEAMTNEILAGNWSIHPNMPQVTPDEARKAGTLSAHDSQEIFTRGDKGERLFDSKNVSPENIRPLTQGKGGNYLNFPHPVFSDSFFEGTSVKKFEKGKAKGWKDFVSRLIVACGGRTAITHLEMNDNEIFVNGMLIEHGFMENSYISSLSQVADMKYLLEQLTSLTVLSLTQDMLGTLFNQTSDQFENPNGKKTNRTFEEYIFLSLCPKLNKFIITDSRKSLTRLQLIEQRKQKKRQSSPLYKRVQQLNNARQNISNTKKVFIKNNGGKYHMSDVQSRQRATQVKYKGGIFGKALYNLLDRLAPSQ